MNTGKLWNMRQRNSQNLSEVKVLDVSLSHVTQFAGIHLIPVILLQAPLFDLHHIYRLLHSICMIFTGSLKPFTCYLQVPFSRFTCYLHGLCPLV